jgi:hypothetical protein
MVWRRRRIRIQRQQASGRFCHSFDEADGDGANTQHIGQEERDEGDDHLVGDIGEEGDEREHPNIARGCGRLGLAVWDSLFGEGLVHLAPFILPLGRTQDRAAELGWRKHITFCPAGERDGRSTCQVVGLLDGASISGMFSGACSIP